MDINNVIFEIFPSYFKTSSLKIIGDVKTVLHGYVKEESMEEHVSEKLKFGLGAGSFNDCTCLGETILLMHKGYTSYIDPDNKLVTTEGDIGLKSPFLMGLEKNCLPSHSLYLYFEEGMALNDVFLKIKPELAGFAFTGCLLFDNLSCSYLKKAPIYKEDINKNAGKYWADTENHSNCYAYVFGIVIKEHGIRLFTPKLLRKAFYINPLEQKSNGFLSHTHAALVSDGPSFVNLKQNKNFYEQVDPNKVTGARHIFTQSIVKEGLLAIFEIDKLIDR